jgi:hypothetical protein
MLSLQADTDTHSKGKLLSCIFITIFMQGLLNASHVPLGTMLVVKVTAQAKCQSSLRIACQLYLLLNFLYLFLLPWLNVFVYGAMIGNKCFPFYTTILTTEPSIGQRVHVLAMLRQEVLFDPTMFGLNFVLDVFGAGTVTCTPCATGNYAAGPGECESQLRASPAFSSNIFPLHLSIFACDPIRIGAIMDICISLSPCAFPYPW